LSAAAQKVLVVGPTWVGDMVMSQVLYRYLHQLYPGISIDVLAPAWSGPILARMPEVRRAIPLPLGRGEVSLGARRALGKSLRPEQYDWAILLPNSFKSALVPFFARIPRRTGWRGEWRYGLLNDLRRLDEQALPLMIQRFAALGLPRGERLPAKLPIPELVVDPVKAQLCRENWVEAGRLHCSALVTTSRLQQRFAQTARNTVIV
jgi:heptosyltransferase-2